MIIFRQQYAASVENRNIIDKLTDCQLHLGQSNLQKEKLKEEVVLISKRNQQLEKQLEQEKKIRERYITLQFSYM